MARPGTAESNPTEALLQNLLKRPDVQSTLILSRKDGSIIKVAGLIAKDFDAASRNSVGTGTNTAESSKEEGESENEADARIENGTGMPRAHALASSIFHFVASAASLSASLKTSDPSSVATSSVNDQAKKEEQTDEKSASGDDIQLLRLRLSKQEVIIFPDPKYLCCVIQDLDKETR